MNTYNHFITDLYNLLPDYQDKFLGIDEIVEEIPSGYVIRPSFTFGTSYQATNLRDAETNIIITLQIFKTHDSNIDILEVAEDIKEKLVVTSLFKIDDYYYSVDTVQFQKQYESKYTSIAVQIYANKTGKIIDVQPWNPDEDTLPLTFLAKKSSTIGIKKVRDPSVVGLQYRYGLDGEWLAYTIDTILPLNKDQKIQFRNTNNSLSSSSNNYVYFVMTGEIEAWGNIMSMLNNVTTATNYGFQRLFFNCSALTRGPKITAIDCSDGSFGSMFEGCINLRTIPDLNLTRTRSTTCQRMFKNCSSLKIAPKLPATTLGTSCYNEMFYGCTSLEVPPELPALTASQSCYSNMFNGCTSLKIAPKLPATTLNASCYYSMFYNCVSLENAPQLLANNLAANCYQQMFQGCNSLKTAPELPATTLAASCYRQMFDNCKNLKNPPTILPATNLSATCYYQMFNGCDKLESAPIISAIVADTQSCYSMFDGCSSLSSVSDLSLSGLANGCCTLMFHYCYSLENAPYLPAATLANACYQNMFYGCTALKTVKVNFTEWVPTNATTNWLYNASTSGTFVCHNTLPQTPIDASHIPQNWTIEIIDE